MTINHMPHSPIEKFTWQSFGFISAAEGFVFLSGLVTGWVYGRTAITQGISAVTKRALRRSLTLYLTNAAFVTFAILAARERLAHLGDGFEPSLSLWAKTMLFLDSPGYSEILRMYCVLFLVVPAIFWALVNKHLHYVLLASGVLWLLAFFGYGMTAIPGSGYFDIVSWQLLFVAGTCCGFFFLGYGRELRASHTWTSIASVVVIAFLLIRHSHFLTGRELLPYFEWLSSWRRTLALGRLVDFAAFAYLVYRFRRPLNKLVHTVPGQAVVFLGRHSLHVFVWSVLASMFAYASKFWWLGRSSVDQTVLTLLVVASCFVPAWLHARWQTWSRDSFLGSRVAGAVPVRH